MERSKAPMTHDEMLQVALREGRVGLEEGGIPIGAALFLSDESLVGSGRNRRVHDGDQSMHAETNAFRNAGRRRHSRHDHGHHARTLLVLQRVDTSVRYPIVVVGESVNFRGGLDWLADAGVEVVDLASAECVRMLRDFIGERPELWHEDIGE